MMVKMMMINDDGQDDDDQLMMMTNWWWWWRFQSSRRMAGVESSWRHSRNHCLWQTFVFLYFFYSLASSSELSLKYFNSHHHHHHHYRHHHHHHHHLHYNIDILKGIQGGQKADVMLHIAMNHILHFQKWSWSSWSKAPPSGELHQDLPNKQSPCHCFQRWQLLHLGRCSGKNIFSTQQTIQCCSYSIF